MAHICKAMLAGSILLGIAAAQSTSVTQIILPFADQQPLDASIIAQSAGATTLLVNCAPDSTSDECGFPEAITLTVGPSTFNYEPSGIYEVVGSVNCKITASTAADCTMAMGIYPEASASQTDDAYITTPAASSSTTSSILSGTDLNYLDVTITAGLEKATMAATGSAVGSGSMTAATGGAASGSHTGTSSSTSATATGNSAAEMLQGPYAGLGVAAVLVAGSMMML